MEAEIDKEHNQYEFSVSEISFALKKSVEENFSYVKVRGEISGFKRAASGHLYFSLKDEQSVLNTICWKGVSAKLPFKPEDGIEVVAVGKISTYPGRSNYQLIVDRMEVAGVGALMALFEKRKKQLAAEGLFDESRKKELPYLPKTIGVVTSETGSVIRDILHRIKERFGVHVLVWPVLVQGEGAAEQVAEAIKGFNKIKQGGKIPRPDVLIVARGGGSLEDLWAFNEEIVARAVAASDIPLISAVGHETDTTLIDFVSDKRAPTPTAAAEIAVPVKADIIAYVYEVNQRLFAGITRYMDEKTSFLNALARGIISPKQMIGTMMQRLDDWSERLGESLPKLLEMKKSKLDMLTSDLKPNNILRSIEILKEKLNTNAKLLESYHYKKVLKRGFALVRDGKGKLVTSVGKVSNGMALDIEFNDGSVKATAGKSGATSGGAPKKKIDKKDDRQESLF